MICFDDNHDLLANIFFFPAYRVTSSSDLRNLVWPYYGCGSYAHILFIDLFCRVFDSKTPSLDLPPQF